MTTLPLNVKATVAHRADAQDHLKAPGDAVIIQRDAPRWMLLVCPCGCGDVIPINLDARAGKAWRFYRSSDAKVSVYPSVWRDTGCESHFILWRGSISLFDSRYDDDLRSPFPGFAQLVETVRRVWPDRAMAHYLDVADALREIPWDVLDACRELEKQGVLVEGRGTNRGYFSRSAHT